MLSKAVVTELIGICGRERVLTEPEDLIGYSFDATAAIPRRRPEAVVMPVSTEEVVQVVKLAGRRRIPIYPRGSGTNLSGGTIPLEGGIVLVATMMNAILEVDAENLTATVQPGVIVQSLNDAVASYGLIYPPDPGTVATATMGGTVAECSGGLRGLKYGVTKHYVMGLEVVLADGNVLRAGGKTVKNVTGYDLVKLFTGSEGTLGIITGITVKLIPAPEHRRTMMAVFADLDRAAKTISEIISHKVIPATLEILDRVTIQAVEEYARIGLPTEAEAILLIEVDGIREVVEKEAAVVLEVCRRQGAASIRAADTDAERDELWAARRAALPALAQLKPTTVLEDATVPRSKIPEMIRGLNDIAHKYRLKIGTFGHAGDGNLHPTILTDASDKEEMARVERAVDEIFTLALQLGGTLSGEHGIGMAKARYLEQEFGPVGVEVMARIKHALDPLGLLNPGKIFRQGGLR